MYNYTYTVYFILHAVKLLCDHLFKMLHNKNNNNNTKKYCLFILIFLYMKIFLLFIVNIYNFMQYTTRYMMGLVYICKKNKLRLSFFLFIFYHALHALNILCILYKLSGNNPKLKLG